MILHKRCTNKTQPTELQVFLLDRIFKEITVNTVGMLWNSLRGIYTHTNENHNLTKIGVLSQFLRIYVPIVLFRSVNVTAKVKRNYCSWLYYNETKNYLHTFPHNEKYSSRHYQKKKQLERKKCFFLKMMSNMLHWMASLMPLSKAYYQVIYIRNVSNVNGINRKLLYSKFHVF